jgi:hypothetical protein
VRLNERNKENRKKGMNVKYKHFFFPFAKEHIFERDIQREMNKVAHKQW